MPNNMNIPPDISRPNPPIRDSLYSENMLITTKDTELEERISVLEGQIKVLKQQVDDLQSRVRKGGFWVKPRI